MNYFVFSTKWKQSNDRINKKSKTYPKKFVLDKNDPIMLNTDETTQASLRLMDQIRNSKLFTMPTKTGDMMRLDQRETTLCVAIAGMRLLCFALILFLGENIQPNRLQELKTISEKIIHFPKKKKENSADQTSGKFFLEFDLQINSLGLKSDVFSFQDKQF